MVGVFWVMAEYTAASWRYGLPGATRAPQTVRRVGGATPGGRVQMSIVPFVMGFIFGGIIAGVLAYFFLA